MELTETISKTSQFLQDLPHSFALICFVVIFTSLLTALIAKRKKELRNVGAFAGPPAHWLLGHVKELKQDGTDFDHLIKWGEQYPLAFPLWFGPFVSFLNIHHPDYAKTLLTSTGPKDDFAFDFLSPWIGEGLLVSNGQKWSRHRRLLTPGFHYNVLKPYTKLISDSAKTMLDKWEGYAQTSESFELFEHVSLMTLDSIMKCAFSCNSDCQHEGGTNAYIKAVYELTHLTFLRFRTFPYHSDIVFHLSPHGFRFRKACRVSNGFIVSDPRQQLDIYAQTQQDPKGPERFSLMTISFYHLVDCQDEKQQGLSDEDIRAEVDTFMFEGHDTTASGISFILYCLACNPEHQQMCRDEIIHALEGKDTIEWEDLSKIPYTTMCIKESLRLYPPVPGILRKTTKPITFFDGRTVPAGCWCICSVFGIHRNATVWENPDVFDPLRFLPENSSNRSPYAFVPFSAGTRNCIGQTFAMNEMKVVVAQTLRRYQLIEDPTRKPKIIPRLVLHSLNEEYEKL
uniref:aromatase n=1 Tax=Myripristis murdjan TaxID=586833 RepID=A0A667YME9_9TELE